MMTRRIVLRALTVVAAIATTMVTTIGVTGCGGPARDNAAQAQAAAGSEAGSEAASESQGRQVPVFEVDPFWPKPLPDHWILGSTIGLDVDSRDHVFIVHRRDSFDERTEMGSGNDPKTADCCTPAPNILEFDPAGNLVNHWGGPGNGYTWPSSNHGITVDHMDNVWVGGNGPTDSHILKFSKDGTFLKQFGEPGVERGDVFDSADQLLGRVLQAFLVIDPMAAGFLRHRQKFLGPGVDRRHVGGAERTARDQITLGFEIGELARTQDGCFQHGKIPRRRRIIGAALRAFNRWPVPR